MKGLTWCMEESTDEIKLNGPPGSGRPLEEVGCQGQALGAYTSPWPVLSPALFSCFLDVMR